VAYVLLLLLRLPVATDALKDWWGGQAVGWCQEVRVGMLLLLLLAVASKAKGLCS
jgi:hypothetical protein